MRAATASVSCHAAAVQQCPSLGGLCGPSRQAQATCVPTCGRQGLAAKPGGVSWSGTSAFECAS
eukprot:13493145-Alexandrium_andersonii.AAC.1